MSVLTEHIKKHFSKSGDMRQDELLTLSLANDAVVMDLHQQLAQSREETKAAESEANEVQQEVEESEAERVESLKLAFHAGVESRKRKPTYSANRCWLTYKIEIGVE